MWCTTRVSGRSSSRRHRALQLALPLVLPTRSPLRGVGNEGPTEGLAQRCDCSHLFLGPRAPPPQ